VICVQKESTQVIQITELKKKYYLICVKHAKQVSYVTEWNKTWCA